MKTHFAQTLKPAVFQSVIMPVLDHPLHHLMGTFIAEATCYNKPIDSGPIPLSSCLGDNNTLPILKGPCSNTNTPQAGQ